MDNKSLHNDNGFKAPKDYFESFEDNLFARLNMEDHSNDINKPEQPGFTMPENYLNDFENELFQKLELDNIPKKGKVISLFSRKQFYHAASIAAVLILVFFIINPFNKGGKQELLTFEAIEYDSFENYLNTGDIELNAYDLADLYDINDEELEELTETTIENNQLYEYLSDEINTEDYMDSL